MRVYCIVYSTGIPLIGVQVRATTGQQHKSLATFILPACCLVEGVVMRCV